MSDSSETVQIFNRVARVQSEGESPRIFYVEALARQPKEKKGTILLIHGFPETSYQFRHVMKPFAEAGYHVIAPDKRGHGYSSKPVGDIHQQDPFTKKSLAQDLHTLVRMHIGIRDKIHVVGHDIGAMVAHAYVSQFPEHVETVTWGECPLPGSTAYDQNKHSRLLWHFDFQSHHPDLAVSLVQGKERIYLMHFFDRLAQNVQGAFPPDVVDFYVDRFSMPDALRCAFLTYRAFEQDADHNRKWRQEKGKVKVRNMILIGENSIMGIGEADQMASEFYEDPTMGVVKDSGHYVSEENPQGFVKQILRFIEGWQ
ncbi:hypothetical protein G647_03269 [Cladophialophora carrionii CBS 160.54]|uniref:AB hydrolase-1 domain-containing protein n=1 Tax=Cladophialophora carrionii CBS 160.54 TaxID=1279043 RepID=V9DKM4_9EURO|nr:uncharacterized protein G647_03269 [Cladophialophora carrionii CBS 160.54]ETI26492.1 hypothetical protein G647_03269 [Cladophialophora carrionii CBS 160.54]